MTYWTGIWDPTREAISKEIDTLRVGARRRSPLVAFSAANATRVRWRSRTMSVASRWWPVLRLAAAVIEPRGDVSHVFGGSGSWHLVRALGRRPVLLTAVVSGAGLDGAIAAKCSCVVVESESSVAEWVKAGVLRERIQLVRPGVDLDQYQPFRGRRSDRFTLLFASTPADVAEIESRGIGLLMELARARPDVDVLVPWRLWGDLARTRAVLLARRPPPNFHVQFGDVPDMRSCYARADATVVCFAPQTGKTLPLFVLEGLASGLPCISGPESGLAGLLRHSRAGIVCDRDVAALSLAVDHLQDDYVGYAERARTLAEQEFAIRVFRDRYEEIYRQLAADGPKHRFARSAGQGQPS